jgi:hypothetical protein
MLSCFCNADTITQLIMWLPFVGGHDMNFSSVFQLVLWTIRVLVVFGKMNTSIVIISTVMIKD